MMGKKLVLKAVEIEMQEVINGNIKTKPFNELKKKFYWQKIY
ncbi:MAG: hypothetical protein PHP82_00090 [Candidatus ainarchaeum sp.]|nr:hypothetical protein [Candidatus ainarchaeum sp.]